MRELVSVDNANKTLHFKMEFALSRIVWFLSVTNVMLMENVSDVILDLFSQITLVYVKVDLLLNQLTVLLLNVYVAVIHVYNVKFKIVSHVNLTLHVIHVLYPMFLLKVFV